MSLMRAVLLRDGGSAMRRLCEWGMWPRLESTVAPQDKTAKDVFRHTTANEEVKVSGTKGLGEL